MAVIKITAADVKRQEVIEAKWYTAQITRISEPAVSAKGDSVNILYDFTVENTGGKVVPHNFNSKGWIQMPELIESITGKKLVVSESEPLAFDTAEHLMQTVDVLLYVDNYGGRLSNKIRSFLPKGKGVNAALPF